MWNYYHSPGTETSAQLTSRINFPNLICSCILFEVFWLNSAHNWAKLDVRQTEMKCFWQNKILCNGVNLFWRYFVALHVVFVPPNFEHRSKQSQMGLVAALSSTKINWDSFTANATAVMGQSIVSLYISSVVAKGLRF